MFLVGKHDPVYFRELLATKLLRVLIHDNDEYNFDTGTVFAVGQA